MIQKFYWFEACRNLMAHKLRASLAIIGIMVGSASLVAMITLGQIASTKALAEFKNLGTDLLSISFIPNTPEGESTADLYLSLNQIEKIPQIAPAVRAIVPYATPYQPLIIHGNDVSAALVATTADFLSLAHVTLAQGRFLSDFDKDNYYCVIGNDIAKMLPGNDSNLIGQQLQIGNNFFTVIGVLNPSLGNSFVYVDLNQAVIIPIAAAVKISPYVYLSNAIASLTPNTDIDATQQAIQNYVQQQNPRLNANFRSAKQLIDSMKHQKQTLTLLLGLIGSITLLVAGIGIMNIMLVSVTERKKEIGIRLAIGARQKDIQWMFLSESLLLSATGGALGLVLGIFTSYGVTLFAHWPWIFFITPLLIGFAAAIIIGVFFGYYPAHQASKLDPIEVLRVD